MSLRGKNVLITGGSIGIGFEIAKQAVKHSANPILFGRSPQKLGDAIFSLKKEPNGLNVQMYSAAVDVSSISQIRHAVNAIIEQIGHIDVLINNAGLAVGAPARFDQMRVEDIDTMIGTNINGMMYATHAVLNEGKMAQRKQGTIINVTSVTGLEVPPFPGEAVYHSAKASQEAFTNVLRTELQGTNIKVQAIRPGIVATHFHEQRIGYDKGMYDDFMKGMEPLIAEDVAEAAMMMLQQPERVSIKALDVVPNAQRSLQVIDRTWNERNKKA